MDNFVIVSQWHTATRINLFDISHGLIVMLFALPLMIFVHRQLTAILEPDFREAHS